jgi:hypothetical protein
LRPEEAAAHAAQVDDVTHQDQGFDVHVLQEIEEQIGAALPGAEVKIRDEGGAQSHRGRAGSGTHAAPYIRAMTRRGWGGPVTAGLRQL